MDRCWIQVFECIENESGKGGIGLEFIEGLFRSKHRIGRENLIGLTMT